jgi:hypothetical protein
MSASRRPSWPPGELRAASQLPQRHAGGVADDVTGTRPQRRGLGHQRSHGVRGEPGSQVLGSGQDQGPGLVERLDPLGARAALGDHQRADRLDGAVAAPGRAGRPPALSRPGGADRVERAGLAMTAAVLPVGPVHLDDPDAGCGDVASQAGAVAAGPFDPGQAHRPEPRQPVQQTGIAGRGGRELPDAEQPADGVERGGGVRAGVGVHPAGDRASLYDGHSHPFPVVEGWHAPADRRTWEAPASDPGQADQTGNAGGCQKNWDPADRSFRRTARAASADSEVRPGPRLQTLRPHQAKTAEAGPEAQSTVSLPILCVWMSAGLHDGLRAGEPVLCWRGRPADEPRKEAWSEQHSPPGKPRHGLRAGPCSWRVAISRVPGTLLP